MKKLLFLMMIFALLCSSLTAQHLLRVNNNTDFDAGFTTLEAAVSSASNGDTIYIEGSATEYAGAVINKQLTIIGPGFFLSENPKTQANNVAATFNSDITFTTGSDGSTIMGCKVGSGDDVIINASDITVIRNHLYNIYFNGTSNNILVAQNYVEYLISTWGSPYGQITNSIISNNIIKGQIITGNSSGSLIVSNNVCLTNYWNFPIDCYNATIQNNILIYDYRTIQPNTGNTISYNIMASDGTNSNGNQYNIDMTSVFADFDGALDMSTDGKWKLKDGSPAIGAGSGGTDCGAFGGLSSYILSGIPNLPHIYEADVPASASSESGLQVTIKVKSGD